MKRRGPYAKGTAKRAEILDTALDVIARNGCHRASNREIAERVGLSQAGLMHYFGSREELYQEVLRARDERDLRDHFLHNPTFAGYLEVIAHNTQVPGLVRLYAEFSAEAGTPGHPAHRFFVERYAFLRHLLGEAIERAQDAGELGPAVDIPQAVDLIVSASDGLQVQWLIDPTLDMTAHLTRLWEFIRTSSWAEVSVASR
ncbi:TetR/AcrR family transcriptional regulator [Microbacterium sp.]|uniref:TetR/AcrR family transcriptional regulator n=1 Tax=Microbacterium sp. TaxID=51671 RepID=UPI0039E617DD